MEPTVDGWQDVLKRYIRSIENLSETALKSIKRDRIQNNLPFDDSFMDKVLRLTNARITNVYTNLLFEEILDGGQNSSNQNANHQIDGNVHANIGHQLTSTTIGNESIEQMPIILVQLNDPSLASNSNANTTFIENGNQMSDQIITLMPQNHVPTASSEVDIPNQNSEQEFRTQSVESIAIVEQLRIENEPWIVSNPHKNNEKPNADDNGIGSRMGATSSNSNGLKTDDLFRSMLNSNINQPETVDLTSDQEDVADSLENGDHSEKEQSQPNNLRPHVCEARAAGNSKEKERFNCSSHGCNHSKCKYSTDDCAGMPRVNKQMQPVVMSGTNIELNSQKTSTNRIADRLIATDYEQHQNVDDNSVGTHKVSNTQHPQMIDLMLHHKGTVSKNSKNATNGTENVGVGSENSGKKSKLIKVVDKTKCHKCDFCEYSAEFKYLLTRHIRAHTNERPFDCKICKKRFTRMDVLNHHMKTHRELFAFQCSNCRKGFSDEKLWKLHESRCKAIGYECHLCSKKFYQQKSSLLKHMRYKHTGEKPFNCTDCQKRFCEKSDLIRHVKCCHKKDN